MNRRSLLASIGGGATLLTGGIAAAVATNFSVGGETTIRTESLSIEPGDGQQTSVTAANVQMVHGAMIDGPTPRSETGEYLELIDFNAAKISPSPGGGMDSYPPYWMWDWLQSQVKITLPVRIPSNTPPDTYRYTIQGWESKNYGNEPTGSADIVVTVQKGDT